MRGRRFEGNPVLLQCATCFLLLPANGQSQVDHAHKFHGVRDSKKSYTLVKDLRFSRGDRMQAAAEENHG